MAEEDFGLNAYNLIQAQLSQWDTNNDGTSISGLASPSPSKRRGGGVRTPGTGISDRTPISRSSGERRGTTPKTPGTGISGRGGRYTPGSDVFSPSSLRYGDSPYQTTRASSVGVETPVQDDGRYHYDEDGVEDIEGQDGNYQNNEGEEEVEEEEDEFYNDGMDSYKPYREALLMYLRRRQRIISNSEMNMDDDGEEAMDIDHQTNTTASAAVAAEEEEAELKFLEGLSKICLLRTENNDDDDEGKDDSSSSRNEGNFWDLLASLRAVGLHSLFYGIHGNNNNGHPQGLELLNDPTKMVESSPLEVLNACLWGNNNGDDDNGNGHVEEASLPLLRLNAALSWIEACHARKFDQALSRDYEGNSDPLLPPPRRRTMWPATLSSLQRSNGQGEFHPDAPLRCNNTTTTMGMRSPSPVDVLSLATSNLPPQDEMDDARLLRACFFLFQSGRPEEAIRLVEESGQPWRAAGWIGGEPLSKDGNGNATRNFWKGKCREMVKMMGRAVISSCGGRNDADGGIASTSGLYPSIAYEAGILALLSDSVDAALENPVFGSWEDGVHAILSSERGIIEDKVLTMHNRARVEAAGGDAANFPYSGTEFDEESGAASSRRPLGHDADMGAALAMLDTCSADRIREGGGDPFRNGMASFLLGQNALKEYIEEVAALAIQVEKEDEACFLRFIAHLVLYVDSVLPELSSQLVVPVEVSGEDGDNISLRELLLLKYANFLSTKRNLWSHVALYASLLSHGNLVDIYTNFLVRVHSDSERQMALEQAREFFPQGVDIQVLRNVVRDMILGDKDEWTRQPGEPLAPAGVSPVDARMMRSIHWLCYHPEHMPDALVCANILLRRFLLLNELSASDTSQGNMYTPKVFMEKVLPEDLVDVAMQQSKNHNAENAPFVPLQLVENLSAEFQSFESYLKAHTQYAQFLDVIGKTSPCHNAKSRTFSTDSRSAVESEISEKMERNAFRQRKMSVCKIIIEAATRASEGLMEVLTFGGGWLVDADNNPDMSDSAIDASEIKLRADEMKEIRSAFLPAAVFMLHEVLDKTAMWLEQMMHDIVNQFEGSSKDIIHALFSSFDETYRSSAPEATLDELVANSHAAPGYWHKKALALASVVASDTHALHETFNDGEMEQFLQLVAESHIQLSHCLDVPSFF